MTAFIPNAFFKRVFEKRLQAIVLLHEFFYFIWSQFLNIINCDFINHVFISNEKRFFFYMPNKKIPYILKCYRRTSKHLKITAYPPAIEPTSFSANRRHRHLRLKHNLYIKMIRSHLVYSSSSSNNSIILSAGHSVSSRPAHKPKTPSASGLPRP